MRIEQREIGKMNEEMTQKIPELPYLHMGSGFIIGLSIGYFLKKSFKIMLFLLGVGLVILFVLENQHIVVIDEKALGQSVDVGSEYMKRFFIFLKERLSSLHPASGASSLAGFAVGLKMG